VLSLAPIGHNRGQKINRDAQGDEKKRPRRLDERK